MMALERSIRRDGSGSDALRDALLVYSRQVFSAHSLSDREINEVLNILPRYYRLAPSELAKVISESRRAGAHDDKMMFLGDIVLSYCQGTEFTASTYIDRLGRDFVEIQVATAKGAAEAARKL